MKEKTIAMLEADLEAAKPFLRYMLEEYNACDEVIETVVEASRPNVIKELIRVYRFEIADRIGVDVADKLREDEVVKYIEENDLSHSASEIIYPHLLIAGDWIEEDYIDSRFGNSLLNEMKFNRFMELIDDVTLDDLDALTAKYRPNGLEATNQMRMVV